MGGFDFEDSVGHWLLEGSQAYIRVLSDELSPHGITFRQCQVLSILTKEGELSQAELAERMGLEPPTLVGVIDRMERGGWIARGACQTDRRKWLVQLTPAAREIWNTVAKCASVVRKRATKGLSEQQLKSLRSIVEAVTENLGGARRDGTALPDRRSRDRGRVGGGMLPGTNRRGPRLK